MQRLRAEQSAETRRRILEAAREMLPGAAELRVEDIARRAAVSVPTLYSHFGSKSGLLAALTGEIERKAGLYAGFQRVWRCQDGEAALREMLDTTLRFWEDAWAFIEFALRVRRIDPEIGGRINAFDESRTQHLVVICRRLSEERRLRSGLTPARAGRLAFGLSTPYIYEALVRQSGLAPASARNAVVNAILFAIVREGLPPLRGRPPDWAKLGLKPSETSPIKG